MRVSAAILVQQIGRRGKTSLRKLEKSPRGRYLLGCETKEILFFTASRAHHAELGGIRPGSMPPDSRNLAEEGVLIRNVKVVEAGEPRLDRLRRLLVEAPYPARAPDENLADVGAQIAANHTDA